MKTNQLMQVDFKHGVLEIEHLTMMGDLAQLFSIGNVYRHQKGLNSVNMDRYTASQAAREFSLSVSNKIGYSSVISKKGKRGGTKAHLYILIDAAMYLDADFKLEVIDRFVNDKLLQWRDTSGDKYGDLTNSIKEEAGKVLGKPAHTGHYVNLAKKINARILPEGHLGWNYATGEQLRERTRIEEALCLCLKNNLVRDWDHLKELAGKV